jgi:hypothetical protein
MASRAAWSGRQLPLRVGEARLQVAEVRHRDQRRDTADDSDDP